MKKAYKKLGTNIGLFAISSFGTKILNLVLVPLYTNCLSTAEYGTADLLTTILQLAIPIFTLNIAGAVIRFLLDKNSDDTLILGIGLKVTFLGSALLIVIAFGVNSIGILSIPTSYILFIIISFFFNGLYTILTNFFRGKDKIVDIVIAGFINTFINCGSNIIFLLVMHMGIEGYLWSMILGIIFPVIYLLFKVNRYKYVCYSAFRRNQELEKQMIKYSTPLIINGVSWWINNSLDRLFVTSICGVDANGLLAVAYKIPSILVMFQTIFNQAWTMSVVQEYDRADKQGFLSKTYSVFSFVLSVVCGMILLFNIPIAKLLYAKGFYEAWQYSGFLVLSQLFSALSICISGVFDAVKDSKTLAWSTMLGAGINTILNTILIPPLGILGAVLATLIAHIIIWIYRMVKANTYIQLKIYIIRDLIVYLLLTLQCIIGRTNFHMYGLQTCIIIFIIFLYRNEVKMIFRSIVPSRWRDG